MKAKRIRSSRARRALPAPIWTPESVGLDPDRFQAMLHYLFDRPTAPAPLGEWYWEDDHVGFVATPLEWTRFQSVLFSNAGTCLTDFSDDQVGMGLNYLMDNGKSDASLAATDASVPHEEAMRMMRAMPGLWRGCLGPRLAWLQAPIGSGAGGHLGHACYMWFDCWYTFYRVRAQPEWCDAMWTLLLELLAMPFREVQISALHGIGHNVEYLDCRHAVDVAVTAFIRNLDVGDVELRNYAEAARMGMVQ